MYWELFYKIQNAKYKLNGPIWDKVSHDAKDLLNKILTVDPRERYSATDSLKHPWIVAAGNGTLSDVHSHEAQENSRNLVSSPSKGSKGESLFGFFKRDKK